MESRAQVVTKRRGASAGSAGRGKVVFRGVLNGGAAAAPERQAVCIEKEVRCGRGEKLVGAPGLGVLGGGSSLRTERAQERAGLKRGRW